MNLVVSFGRHLSKYMDYIGGVVLIGMMLLTVIDVFMRYIGIPFMGTYELVAMAGAVVIGFGFPETTLIDGNVRVDFLLGRVRGLLRKLVFIITKLIAIAVFAALGIGMIEKAMELQAAKEASLTLRVPIFPLGYALAACSFAQCIAILSTLIEKIFLGDGHE